MKTPFNMIITGRTCCGKTYLLETLEKEYMKHFDFIILICPTFEHKTYQEWKYIDDPDFIAILCSRDNINLMLKHIVDVYKGTNSLIILDDCASGQDVKNRTSELVKLAFSARHYSLSTIIITQQLTSIFKPYRENISKLVTFHNPNRNDMKTITDDYLYGVEKDEIYVIINKLKKNKYAQLEISLRHPYEYEVVIPQLK